MTDRLLDTCIVIDLLRGDARATGYLASLEAPPSISAVTWTEVFSGLRSQSEEVAARSLLVNFHPFAVIPQIAETAGNMLRHYRPSHATDFADALIAATAEHHGLELATRNVKHFPMIKRLKAAY